MTPTQIEIIQGTWQSVSPMARTTADLFYERMFTLDPTLRATFPGELALQKKRLMWMVGRVVANLREPSVTRLMRGIGQRELGARLTENQYAMLGEALLWTLRSALGERLTPSAEQAWQQGYAHFAELMTEGVHHAA